jgi:hypothetical protein
MELHEINTIFPYCQTVIVYSTDHIIIKIKISELLKSTELQKIINWKYNRPPDYIRCNEIAKDIYDKKQEIDWLFYMIYEKDVLHIVDGCHRINALHIIKRENSKPVDHLTPNIFANNNIDWLYEKSILISVRKNMTTGQAIDLFQSLNKSNPVPDLYMFDIDNQKRITIEAIVNEWITAFGIHFTSSKNPNIPNMNRDRFIEILDCVYKKYSLNNSNSYLLNEKLYTLNAFIKNNLPKKISEAALEKSKKTGCYIFLLRREQLQERI